MLQWAIDLQRRQQVRKSRMQNPPLGYPPTPRLAAQTLAPWPSQAPMPHGMHPPVAAGAGSARLAWWSSQPAGRGSNGARQPPCTRRVIRGEVRSLVRRPGRLLAALAAPLRCRSRSFSCCPSFCPHSRPPFFLDRALPTSSALAPILPFLRTALTPQPHTQGVPGILPAEIIPSTPGSPSSAAGMRLSGPCAPASCLCTGPASASRRRQSTSSCGPARPAAPAAQPLWPARGSLPAAAAASAQPLPSPRGQQRQYAACGGTAPGRPHSGWRAFLLARLATPQRVPPCPAWSHRHPTTLHNHAPLASAPASPCCALCGDRCAVHASLRRAAGRIRRRQRGGSRGGKGRQRQQQQGASPGS